MLTQVSSTMPKTPSPWAALLGQADQSVQEETIDYIHMKLEKAVSKPSLKQMLQPLLPAGTTCPNAATTKQIITAILHLSPSAELDLLDLVRPAKSGGINVTVAHSCC